MSIARLLRRAAALLLSLVLLLGLLPTGSALQIGGYSEGLALTTDGTLWGYSNVAGELVIPLQFHSAVSFSLGLAAVEVENRLGVIRQDGTYLIPPEYGTLLPIGYGLYIAQKGEHWGVLSILPLPSLGGGSTQELYPLEYDKVELRKADGLEVLALISGRKETLVPLTSLPSLLVERRVPSAQFPLIRGKLPKFTDVSPRSWYDLWVDIAYNVELMQGVGDSRFAPLDTLSVAEALKLAAHMESRYRGDDFHLQPIPSGQPWYRSSVSYCVASGIIKEGEFTDFTRPITRAEMAKIFAATSLARNMPDCNPLARVKSSVPDVSPKDYAADAIYTLYAKGIFTGSDDGLTFRPNASLTRAEGAAIVSRMARAEQRITLWP
jgi:hypothetical protein